MPLSNKHDAEIMTAATPKRGPRVVLAAKLLFALILVSICVLKVDAGRAIQQLDTKLLTAMLIIQPVAFLSLVPMACRFSLLTNDHRSSFGMSFKAIVLANGLNSVLPFRSAELFKAMYLKEHGGVAISSGMSAVFLERLSDLFVVMLMVMVGMGMAIVGNARLYVVMLFVVVIAVAVTVLNKNILWNLAAHIPVSFAKKFIIRIIDHLTEGVTPAKMLKAFWYGGQAWFLSYLSFYLFMICAGSINIGVTGVLALFLATTIGYAVPTLPGGAGTYEAAAIFVLKKYGYGFDEALVLALALHLGQLLFCVVGAFLIVSFEKVGVLSSIKQVRAYLSSHDGTAASTQKDMD